MKQNNPTHHGEMIRYGEPFFGTTRRRSRTGATLAYNDRSPEVAAMNAHLRASAYGEGPLSAQPAAPRLTNRAALTASKLRSFLHLGREYDFQARDNFAKEAVLFVFIAALSVWPMVHAIKAMAGR